MRNAARTVILLLALAILGNCRYLVDADNATRHDRVEEVHHAVCKVATKEIQASANATITRQLKGVCSTKAMNARLDELQRILLTEIEIFKLMLISAGYTTPMPVISTPVQTKSSGMDADYEYAYDFNGNTNTNALKSLESPHKTHNSKIQTKNINKEPKEIYPRENEVRKTNETLQKTEFGQAFVYYWRIDNFEDVLKQDVEIVSPMIEYLGNSLYIKLTTRYLGSNYVSLEILTPKRRIHPFRFVFMHRKEKNDFNSPMLGNSNPPAKLFRVTRGKIQSFTFGKALLIKLLVYLDL